MGKPWQTKEWKTKRAQLIAGKSCAWCGSTERLTVHQQGSPDTAIGLPLYRRISQAMFAEYVASEAGQTAYAQLQAAQAAEEPTPLVAACPRCDSAAGKPRKTKKPRYRCPSCRHEFDEPVHRSSRTEGTPEEQVQQALYWAWFPDAKAEIRAAYDVAKAEARQQYLKMENIEILCNRCHFAALRGKVLCQQCKAHYHAPKFDRCWECRIQNGELVLCKVCQDQYHAPEYETCYACQEKTLFDDEGK